MWNKEYQEYYLESGLLMSCSGLRFSPELKKIRSQGIYNRQLKFISATILNDVEKFADFIQSVFDQEHDLVSTKMNKSTIEIIKE